MRPNFYYLFLVLILFTNCQKNNLDTTSLAPAVTSPMVEFWQKDSPAAHGFSEPALATVVQEANKLNNFYALLIIRNQKLLVEEYFEGWSEATLFELRSITKNITSALTGIAIKKEWLTSVDDPIYPYFPDLEMGDKQQITFRHLLNMSSGLSWDEDNNVLGLIQQQIHEPVNFILSQPLITTPGSTFSYNSLSPHVVAQVLIEAQKKTLATLVKEEIFDTLGIQQYTWSNDPKGANWGGFGLKLRAKDIAKFGQLYLNEGKWEGTQLIPVDWIQQSSKKQINSTNSGYSFQWWVSLKSETPLYYGQGYGGQGLFIFPEKDLIIVAFQEAWVPATQSNQQWKDFREKVFTPILMALED